jgi:hypothetical protein
VGVKNPFLHLELGDVAHGTEVISLGAIDSQLTSNLGTVAYGTEIRYLGVVGHDAEFTSRGIM